ncbi:MAG: hypothetical protein WCI03_10745 [bacterium]
MKMNTNTELSGKQGSILVTSVIMLAIAGIAVGAILTSQFTFTRIAEISNARDKAAFFADAGLQSALVKLNAASDGNISLTESRGYFGRTNNFTASDWGFQSHYFVTNGASMVTSTGQYNSCQVVVQAQVELGAGNRTIHALYAHALFAGDSSGSNYTMAIGGTSSNADFVRGDVYSGWNLTRSGDALLRLTEILVSTNNTGIFAIGDTWTNAYAVQSFTNALTQSAFDTYKNSMAPYSNKVYNNGQYDFGEAYVDTIGDGQYTPGEPFTDVNGNGVWDTGDSFIDRNGNGVYNAGIDTVVDHGNGRWDAGEEWVEDSSHSQRVNGKYDPAGGYWSGSTWKTSYKVGKTTYYCTTWPAESYEDVGDGVYTPAEPYVDQNGHYDVGEQYVDDRNSIYDYGTQTKESLTGMPAPAAGQLPATGHNPAIDPPDLQHMYYSVSKSTTMPSDALPRWGNDVLVNAADYGTAKAITDLTRPEHIFVRNPPKSGSVSSSGKTIYGRSYTSITNAGVPVDDYFFEDPADSSYNSSVSSASIDGTAQTAPMYINVKSTANGLLYYVDGNVWIHHPQVYSMRFRTPGTRITIVASGNITISDEFYYNADYKAGLTPEQVNSTIVNNPSDAFCLIALKRSSSSTNTGNIFIGDAQFGTGGSIHALLYAENNFIDNNLNSSGQPYISIFGNMTAGNLVSLNRPASGSRTRLDVTLDERIRNGTVIVPGLPYPVGSQRSIILDTAWHMVPGTWSSWSILQ